MKKSLTFIIHTSHTYTLYVIRHTCTIYYKKNNWLIDWFETINFDDIVIVGHSIK